MIRTAAAEDAGRLLEIYSYYVENTAVSFEYDTPSVEEFRNRISAVLEKFPYLVWERDGKISGYAYASPFKERKAYERAVETTIYVDKDERGKGLGRELYMELERILAQQNIINLNAYIAYPEKEDEYLTGDSVSFHEHMGYRAAGELNKCGYKFGRWYNLVIMEKCIEEHVPNPEPVIYYKQLPEELK